jgi:hypothetical protein
MYSIEKTKGRLILAAVASPLTADDVDGIVQRVRMNVLGQPGRVVCFADLTRLDGLPPEAVDAFVAMFTRDNPKVERSAFLLARSTSAVALQVNRMIRAAKSPSRMAFEDALTLRSWLGEVLDVEDRRQLKDFLARPHGAVHVSTPPPASGPKPEPLVAPPSSKSGQRPPPSSK